MYIYYINIINILYFLCFHGVFGFAYMNLCFASCIVLFSQLVFFILFSEYFLFKDRSGLWREKTLKNNHYYITF